MAARNGKTATSTKTKSTSSRANGSTAAKASPRVVTQEPVNYEMTTDQRRRVIEALNLHVADQHVLYVKTRKYHWNVVGPHFYSIHKLLESQYEAIADTIDETAERVRMLGGLATGTMTEFCNNARLKEVPGRNPSARDMLADLLADHEAVIRQLREDIDLTDEAKDMPTSDFLTGLSFAHEKMAWMLRSMIDNDETLE